MKCPTKFWFLDLLIIESLTRLFCYDFFSAGISPWPIRFGRRKGYLATAFFTGLFGLVSAFSPSFVWMLILRGLLGFGIGGSPVAFSFLTEFLPRANRGSFLIFFEAFWTVGTVVEVLLAWIIQPNVGNNWRYLLAASSIPLWILLAFYPFLPESPRWLLISGDHRAAVKVIEDAAEANKVELPKNAHLSSEVNVEHRGNVTDLIAPGMRRLTLLLWVLWITHAIIYYGNVLFTPKFYGSSASLDASNATSSAIPYTTEQLIAGASNNQASFFDTILPRHLLDNPIPLSPATTSTPTAVPTGSTAAPGGNATKLSLYAFVLLTTIAELPGLFGAAFLVERVGRKKTMSIMLAVCACATLALLIPFPKVLSVILLSFSRMGINGAIATLWTYTPEAYPTTLRATGLGAANALAKLATTATPFFSTALPDNYLWVAVLVFAACCVIGIVAALALPFDTKSATLSSTLSAIRQVTNKKHFDALERGENQLWSGKEDSDAEHSNETENLRRRSSAVEMDDLGISLDEKDDDKKSY